MRILVVGGGGREHALVWKIRQSPVVKEVYCAPGNAGIKELADCVPIDTSNIVELADFAQTIRADLTVVGPELPMVLGIAEEFHRRNMSIFCPSRGAAEIEGSKAFARGFMDRHGIPSPRYAVCATKEEVDEYLQAAELGYPVVVKADGLAGGKGTTIAEDASQLQEQARALMEEKKFGAAGARIVLEEFLEGEEVSFFALSDGARVLPLVSVQDHKRALDGDQGPNTGGMGTVSPATNLSLDIHKQVMSDVVVPTVKGMADEGRKFQGVLYVGLMITADGPKVLEFNARFGDPECQVMMARLRSDVVPLLAGVADGDLGDARLEWAKEPACCVVLASRGYPDKSETGQPIDGLEELKSEGDIVVYHAATSEQDGRILTAGGRVLGVTAVGANLGAAVGRAYEGVDKIRFDGMQYRRDIGRSALARLQKQSG